MDKFDIFINQLFRYLDDFKDNPTYRFMISNLDRQELANLNRQGKDFFRQGELEQALVNFKKAVELNPSSVVANNYLSWLYWQIGNIQHSLKHQMLAQSGNVDFNSSSISEFQEILTAVRPYTMLSEARLFSLYCLAQQICLDDIPGDFVECGTWRGGSAALLAWVIKRYSLRPRLLYSFDTFEGMPEPTGVDRHNGIHANDISFKAGTLKAPILEGLDFVCRALEVRDIVVPVQGVFSQTLPQYKSEVGNIALLHADGDWYESTMDIFNTLFEQVVDDGIVQIDDYGFWEGCRKAIQEFERSQNMSFALRSIDDTGVWFRKEVTTYSDCNHWRAFWYLAQAAEKMGDVWLAEKAARAVLKIVPGLATAQEMLARIQKPILKEKLNLREINLIIFPDWTQPEELLLPDIESVIRAIMTHLDSSYMTLLIETSNISEEEANLIISGVVMKILYEEESEITDEPAVSFISKFSQVQWKALKPKIDTCLRMKHENDLALVGAEMEDMPYCEVSIFSNQRAFQLETGTWQLK